MDPNANPYPSIPRVVIFDIDGTLTRSKAPIGDVVADALARLSQKTTVGIMSGGSYAQFQDQILARLPSETNLDNLFLFPTSAAQCYGWDDGEWKLRYDNSFSAVERDEVLAALHDALAETGFDKPPPELWGEQTEDRGAQISWSALGQKAPYEAKKDWDPDRAKRAPLAAALLRRLPDFSVRMNATNTIDITKKGIDKAYGIRQLSAMLGVPIGDMIYVGDALFPGGNDEVVKETGIATRSVQDPEDTGRFIASLLR